MIIFTFLKVIFHQYDLGGFSGSEILIIIQTNNCNGERVWLWLRSHEGINPYDISSFPHSSSRFFSNINPKPGCSPFGPSKTYWRITYKIRKTYPIPEKKAAKYRRTSEQKIGRQR